MLIGEDISITNVKKARLVEKEGKDLKYLMILLFFCIAIFF